MRLVRSSLVDATRGAARQAVRRECRLVLVRHRIVGAADTRELLPDHRELEHNDGRGGDAAKATRDPKGVPYSTQVRSRNIIESFIHALVLLG